MMNANELADELENVGMEQKHYDTMQQAATMLRQQKAEIEALKMEIHSLTYGERLAEYLKKAQEK
jgi:hypothetical protein